MAADSEDALASGTLAAGEAYFRGLIEASQSCMWVLTARGVVAHMNARGRRLLGLEAPAMEATPLRDLWPEANRFSLDRAIAAAAAGQDQKFRAFIDGAYWETLISPVIDADGVVRELLVVSRDVTATVETQAFLETVIQLLPAPLFVRNVHDRRHVLLNRAAEELVGVEREEGLGKTLAELAPPSLVAEAMSVDDAVLASGEVVRIENVAMPTLGGEPRYLNFKVLATQDDLGPRHLVSIGDDVTERRAVAESLRTALAEAEQASKAKSAFIANMSHEIRTPLNGIMAGIDLLGREDLSDRGRELAAMIQASGAALDRLLSDILDIARAQAGQITLQTADFHLGETLRALTAPFAESAGRKGVTLELALDADVDGMVSGDGGRLRQVLTNLVSNAEKFTQAGRILVQATRPAPDRVRFCVRDTGIGFDPAGKARLFDRFYQADQSYTRRFEGSGLGLAIAKDLVARMGGALDCDGREGAGADFWFEIALPARPNAVDEARTTGISTQSGLRILLADDHPTNRRVVQLMLADVADIVSVEDGAQAVDAFRYARFDAVLMDMQMPVMDGLSAVREIRALEAERGMARTPIIMLTANALAEHREASARAGADHHVGKPITAETLFSALAFALSGPDAEDDNLNANFEPAAPRLLVEK